MSFVFKTNFQDIFLNVLKSTVNSIHNETLVWTYSNGCVWIIFSCMIQSSWREIIDFTLF